jgi:hypothetical protein
MPNHRLRFLILPALALGALLYALPRTENRNSTSATTEPVGDGSGAGRILVEKTYESYAECDETAEAAAQELKGKGVRTALAARNAMAGSTLYKVYYPDGAVGRITCRGGRLVHEILE